jgi:Glycosyl hydrolases family 2, TIM barrel domain/Glycosyl hydrolases family 2, sugar binding domain
MMLASDALDTLGRGYPRPQLRRDTWISLNGEWECMLDRAGACSTPDDVTWDRTIVVPFSMETRRSGIEETGFCTACWYRRRLTAPPLSGEERLLLHFGAVDFSASVWVNDTFAGSHEGGYTPFTIDITTLLRGRSSCEIVVRAEDDPADLTKPRGKQDWQLEPHSIWYPRTTGIWQTVWLEKVPPSWIGAIRWTSSLESWEIGFEARLAGRWRDGLRLALALRMPDGTIVGNDSYSLTSCEVARRIVLSDPGIDDSRNEWLWSPASPNLIDVRLELSDARGEVLDRVHSYTALRTVSTQVDRFLLNGRPFPLRLVLDQGYWESTGLTAPDDRAFQQDIALVKAMGFNGVRKHQKVEDPRFLYWADRLGLLVWEEMPSAYRFTWESIERVIREWGKVIERDVSHPCIVSWVPFNESWGAPNLPQNPAERHYVRAVYHLTKTLDPTRPVIGNDGWESVATDIIGIHDYDTDVDRIARRYHVDAVLPRLFRRERPGGRLLVLDGPSQGEHPLVLSEFGGIAYAEHPASWGYSRAASADELSRRYSELLTTIRSLDLLCGFCYTQFADTFQEANGLLYADRRPKFPLDEICAATRGWRDVQTSSPALEPEPQAGGVEVPGRD